jgi:hypothetical protein
VAVIEVLQDVLKSLNLSIATGIPGGLAEVVGVGLVEDNTEVVGGVTDVDVATEVEAVNVTELPAVEAEAFGPGPWSVIAGGKLDDDAPEAIVGVLEPDAASDVTGMDLEAGVTGMGFGGTGFWGVCFPPLRVPPISRLKFSFGPWTKIFSRRNCPVILKTFRESFDLQSILGCKSCLIQQTTPIWDGLP